MFFYNIPGENHDVIHDFDANLVDDSRRKKMWNSIWKRKTNYKCEF